MVRHSARGRVALQAKQQHGVGEGEGQRAENFGSERVQRQHEREGVVQRAVGIVGAPRIEPVEHELPLLEIIEIIVPDAAEDGQRQRGERKGGGEERCGAHGFKAATRGLI